jgi:hypothetical protein
LKFTKFPNRFWKLKNLNRISLYRTNFGGTKLSDLNWLMWSRIFGYKDHLRIWSVSGLYLVFHLKIMCSFVVWFIILLCSTRPSCIAFGDPWIVSQIFILYPLVLYQKLSALCRRYIYIYIYIYIVLTMLFYVI